MQIRHLQWNAPQVNVWPLAVFFTPFLPFRHQFKTFDIYIDVKRSQAPEGMKLPVTYFGLFVLAVSHIESVFVVLCVVFFSLFSKGQNYSISITIQIELFFCNYLIWIDFNYQQFLIPIHYLIANLSFLTPIYSNVTSFQRRVVCKAAILLFQSTHVDRLRVTLT